MKTSEKTKETGYKIVVASVIFSVIYTILIIFTFFSDISFELNAVSALAMFTVIGFVSFLSRKGKPKAPLGQWFVVLTGGPVVWLMFVLFVLKEALK